MKCLIKHSPPHGHEIYESFDIKLFPVTGHGFFTSFLDKRFPHQVCDNFLIKLFPFCKLLNFPLGRHETFYSFLIIFLCPEIL